ncbi:proline-rich transmembrane protein 3 [Lissotriton helveticus]
MMVRPAELHLWTFLVTLVLSKPSLLKANIEDVGSDGPNELSREIAPRNGSHQPFQEPPQAQGGGAPLSTQHSDSTEPMLVNILTLQDDNRTKQETFVTSHDSRLPLGGNLHSQTLASPPISQGGVSQHTLQSRPIDNNLHVEPTREATFGQTEPPSLAEPSPEVQDSLAPSAGSSAAPANQDTNTLDHKNEQIFVSSMHSGDLKDKSVLAGNGGPGFQTLGANLEERNDLEIFAHVDGNMERRLSTVRPTVSTVSLVTSPRIQLSEINPELGARRDLHVESTNTIAAIDPRDNTLEAQNSFPNVETNALEPSVSTGSHRVENMFIDDNFIPWNDQGGQSPVSEKYLASYRTTQGYSTMQERSQIPTSPGTNEVLSVDIENLADPVLDKRDVTVNNSKYAAEEPGTGREDIITANSGTFFSKSTKEASISTARISQIQSSEDSLWTTTKTPKHSEPTWSTWFTKGNPPDSLSTYLSGHVTLETKAKTWTETLFAHQLSTRKPVSIAVQGVDVPEEHAPHATAKDANPKTPTPDMHVFVLQPRETASPSVLALSKDPSQGQDSARTSTQVQRGTTGPVVAARTGTSPGALEYGTPVTWKTPGSAQLESAIGSTGPYSIPHEKTITASPQISSGMTTLPKIPVTGRRGQIRVTTQRALQRPRLVEALPSVSSFKEPLLTPSCQGTHGACELLLPNKTYLQWNDLKRTLSFAWELHVYGTAVLYLILSIIALINLIGSPILQTFNLPYVMASNALLVLVGLLRAVYFFTDPYATKATLSPQTALVLYNITFPLILTTFAVLVLMMLKMAQLEVLPPKIQSLPLLAVVAVVHFIVLFSADLFSHFLNPSVNIVLHFLSASWGMFLMVGNVVAYHKLRKSSDTIVNRPQVESPASDDTLDLQIRGRNLKCLFTSSRVLLACSVFGLLCCGLQVYAVLWLFEILGRFNEFSWSWWFLQFWYRIFELALCFSMLFVASHSFCQKCGSSDHTCWAKIVQYLCTYSKTETPEYPNNCYDWANGHQDKSTNNDISKSLIRNPPENVPLKALKDNNENKITAGFYNAGSSSPLARPKPGLVFGPKSQNVTIGRSHTSICFEKESMLSLADLEFRPPSPINLSRSIDEALFREHLVRDSIFLDSSLQYPSYLSRQDSCSSLKECSALNQTIDPLISSDLKMRRNSIPDYMYSLARCSSVTDVNSPSVSLPQSKDLPDEVTTEAAASVSSLDSFSKGSIKISWNPWRHGRSSIESLPLEDAPSTQLLAQASESTVPTEVKEPKKGSAKSLIKLSQGIDCHSISSDTIEL